MRREVFVRLAEQIAAQREARIVTEEEVLADFAAESAVVADANAWKESIAP